MLKNSWIRHLILVLYLFQFLFITREYWRGTKDFFSIVANHSICKNKNQWMNFAHGNSRMNFFVFIQFYLWSFSLEQRLPWSSWMNWMMTSMDAMKMKFVFFLKVCCIILVTLIFWISFDDSLHFTCRIRRLCLKTTQNSSRNLRLL